MLLEHASVDAVMDGIGEAGVGFDGVVVGGDFSDGAEKNDIVGLQAGTFSWRLFGTGASVKA